MRGSSAPGGAAVLTWGAILGVGVGVGTAYLLPGFFFVGAIPFPVPVQIPAGVAVQLSVRHVVPSIGGQGLRYILEVDGADVGGTEMLASESFSLSTPLRAARNGGAAIRVERLGPGPSPLGVICFLELT